MPRPTGILSSLCPYSDLGDLRGLLAKSKAAKPAARESVFFFMDLAVDPRVGG
jgi:hypothetical protein